MIGRPLSGRPLAGRPLGGRALAFGDGQNASGKGVGDIIRSIFADGTDGFYYNFSTRSKLWQNTAGSTPVAAAGDNIARADDSSPRGRNATQATAAAQPKWQTGGLARFDGVDDLLDTPYLLGAGGNSFGVRFKAAASGTLLGLVTASRFALSVNNTTGFISFAYGTGAVVTGNVDLRGDGLIHTAFCVSNGVNGFLYLDAALVGSGALAGSHSTIAPIPIGAARPGGGGGPGSWISADVYHTLGIQKALTAADIAAITNLWGTA